METELAAPRPIEQFDAATLIPERPFTDPALSLADLRALHRCAARLRALLHSGLLSGRPLARYEWEDEAGLAQRIILKPDAIARLDAPLTVVGFFGQRRMAAARGPIDDVDVDLVAEIADHEDVLAYYTAALPGAGRAGGQGGAHASGDYANLVLCASDGARAHWNRSPRHIWAVRELAPAYYHSIRLHNGLMAQGLRCSAGPVLTCTKYYDYDGAALWRAVRTFAPPLALN